MNNQEREAKIKAIAEQLKADARKSHQKKKEKDGAPKKRIQEVGIGQYVPGTDVIATDYESYVERMQGSQSDEFVEDVRANPDRASDENTPYTRALTGEGEIQMQAILETMAELTPQQKKILALSQEGVWSKSEEKMVYTEQAIADELGIARTTVQDALNRIRMKIKRRLAKLKATKD